MENEKRLRRCCFTGHRPEKLNISEKEVKLRLYDAILSAVENGFTTFISGMARGVDLWAAEIVLSIKKENPSVKLICASPFKGFEKHWAAAEKELYHTVLKHSDLVKYVSPHYSPFCFQVRNQYMVDNSSLLIAAYSGESGGTRNTVKYAAKQNMKIINIID